MSKLSTILALTLAALLLASCGKHPSGKVEDSTVETWTIIFYGSAYNNLSSDIKSNIEVLSHEALPLYGAKKKLLVFTHCARNDSDFSSPVNGYLVQMSLNYKGLPQFDTLKTYPSDILSTDPAVMRTVLNDAAAAAPSDHYGLILSSHGTGWLPEGYYNNGERVFRNSKTASLEAPANGFKVDLSDDGLPKTKSFGAEFYRNGGNIYSHEMVLSDLAAGLPYKFDYIIFDACFMGGVETAWELREKAGKICFSSAEILAEGFDYRKFGPALIKDNPSPEEFAKAFFEHYDAMKGAYRTATITVVDCSRMQPLADVCRDLFDSYRGALSSLDPSGVQPYFRDGKHWFYDLEDILVKAGISQSEKASLESALGSCITYKAATPSVLNLIDIVSFSGLSMYLPCDGSANLDNFYKTLAWNRATGLVE